MGVSTFLSGALLEASIGRSPLSVSAPVFLALLRVPALASDTGVTLADKEVDYDGYGRVALATNVWGAPDLATATMRNVSEIDLAPPVGPGSSSVRAWAISTHAVGGAMLWRGNVQEFIIAPSDPNPKIGIGLLVLSATP